MIHDDEFDDLLRDAAATYNAPPVPPRDAMWTAISRARETTAVVPIATARPARRWGPLIAAAAAVLLLGIAIGRSTRGEGTLATTVATTGLLVDPVAADSFAATPSAPVPPDLTRDVAAPQRAVSSYRRATSAGQRNAATPAQRGARIERESAANDRASDAMTYRFAVVEHLTRAEVLLTSFRAQARTADGAQLDAHFTSLARELLGTTRLLLSTRGTEDPAITRLLEDLELVLMQLSQYAKDGRRIDLDAINQSLDKRNVLPKLRSTIPAGVSASAGT